jgi:hypothetical protein
MNPNPIARLESLFSDFLEIETVAFFGSDLGGAEARAMGTKGQAIKVDIERVLGELVWRNLCRHTQAFGPLVFSRATATAQAFSLFGQAEAAKYEVEQMGLACHFIPKRRPKGKRRARL